MRGFGSVVRTRQMQGALDEHSLSVPLVVLFQKTLLLLPEPQPPRHCQQPRGKFWLEGASPPHVSPRASAATWQLPASPTIEAEEHRPERTSYWNSAAMAERVADDTPQTHGEPDEQSRSDEWMAGRELLELFQTALF